MINRKFVFVHQNKAELVLTLIDDKSVPMDQVLVAGLLSNPQFTEIPFSTEAQIGWKFDGTNVINTGE